MACQAMDLPLLEREVSPHRCAEGSSTFDYGSRSWFCVGRDGDYPNCNAATRSLGLVGGNGPAYGSATDRGG